jgi:hypothetical protein
VIAAGVGNQPTDFLAAIECNHLASNRRAR